MGFNPIQDGDWQGLNIALEKLFFTNAEAKTVKQTAKKTGSVSARKTVTIKTDASSETADGSLAKPTVSVVDDGQGAAIYIDGGADENVTIPDTGIVYRTQAKIAVPSSYFLDLRGLYVDSDERRYTADVAILHDVNNNTVTLTSVDETNKISTAGPIAGGRDQAGAFDDSSWVNFYIIYNPTTKDVSSLSSVSATAPTLPAGYTFFVRVGAVWKNGSGDLVMASQISDKFYISPEYGLIFGDTAPGSAGALESISLENAVPPTAKSVGGHIGTTAVGAAVRQMYVCAISSIGQGAVMAWFPADYDPGTGTLGLFTPVFFELPIITSQTLWWTGSSTESIYGMIILCYQDDL